MVCGALEKFGDVADDISEDKFIVWNEWINYLMNFCEYLNKKIDYLIGIYLGTGSTLSKASRPKHQAIFQQTGTI
jgi:hypothetical protein